MPTTSSRLLRAGFSAALFSLSAPILALPALQEPRLQPLMAAVQTEYQRHVANPAPLAAPDTGRPWPCAVPEKELDLFTDTVGSDEDSVKKALSEPARVVYENKIVTPIRAQCEAGKLSGPVEFWIEYDERSELESMEMRSRYRVHVQANARDGKPDGIVLHKGTRLSQKIRYQDPQTQELMAKQPSVEPTDFALFRAFETDGPMPRAIVATSSMVLDGQLMVTTYTRFLRDNGQMVEDQYGMYGNPEHHDYRQFRRNGRLHGPRRIFGGVAFGSLRIEPSVTCWQQGEKLLTVSCPED